MRANKTAKGMLIGIIYTNNAYCHVAEEIALGIEEQGVQPELRYIEALQDTGRSAMEYAQQNFGSAICITEKEVSIFAEETGGIKPLLTYDRALWNNELLLRNIGKNAVHIITKQPFDLME